MGDRQATWLVHDRATDAIVAAWTDVPVPTINARADGPSPLTLRLPYLDSEADQGIARGVAWGNRLDLYVATERSQLVTTLTSGSTYGSGPYGSGPYGSGGYGVALGSVPGLFDSGVFDISTFDAVVALAYHLYRGVMEEWTDDRDARALDVAVSPVARVAELAYLPAGAVYTGCPVQIARSVVEEYAPALVWDTANPVTCGVNGASVTIDLSRESVRGALDKLRALSGSGWFAGITPAGIVRFRAPEVGTPTHRLGEGADCTGVKLIYSGVNRRTRVEVAWSGGTAVAQSVSHSTLDPRTEQIAADHLTTEGDAARLAALKVAELDQLDYRGSVTVLPSFEMEAISVGDTVLVQTDGAVEVSVALFDEATFDEARFDGGGVYGSGALAVAELSYTLGGVDLTFARPRPLLERQLLDQARALQTLRAVSVGV